MKRYDLLRAFSMHSIVAVGETVRAAAAGDPTTRNRAGSTPRARKTLEDLLRDVDRLSAQLRPEAAAIATLSHATDIADAAHNAHAAHAARATKDVLVTCHDRYYLTVALLAAWRMGWVVALPPNAREETLRELAPRCALALHDGAGIGTNVCDALELDVPGESALRARAAAPLAATTTATGAAGAHGYPTLCAEQPLLTIYTSGSTGTPTACRKTAAQLLGEGQTLQQTFQLSTESCVLASVPAHHIYGLLFTVVLPLAAGARFVRDTPLLTSVIEDYAGRYRADVLISVPPHLRVLAESDLSTLQSIRTIFSSGAPLPEPTAHSLHKRFGVGVVEVLGSTETGGFAYRRFDATSLELGARFQPFPGVTVDCDDEHQLLLSSPLLDANLTQPITCPDRVELQPDGSFRHLGRSDGVIKVGGTRLSLAELELRVRELEGVGDVVALPTDAGGARGQEVWLVIATQLGQELPELRAHLLRYYDPVLLPRRVRFVETLPRETTGKLMRTRLLELFQAPKAETMQP